MSIQVIPSMDVRLWLRDKTNRDIEDIDYGLLKDIFHISITAFQKVATFHPSRSLFAQGMEYQFCRLTRNS